MQQEVKQGMKGSRSGANTVGGNVAPERPNKALQHFLDNEVLLTLAHAVFPFAARVTPTQHTVSLETPRC